MLDVDLRVNFQPLRGDEGGVWLHGGVDIGPEPVPDSHFVGIDVDACCTLFASELVFDSSLAEIWLIVRSHVITKESSVWVWFLNEGSGFVVHTFR